MAASRAPVLVIVIGVALSFGAAAAGTGERILVVARAGSGSAGVYVAGRAERSCRRLRQLPSAAGEPSLSPDGARLATFVSRGIRDHDLRVLETGARRARTLARLRSASPARPLWSADGRRLAYGDGAAVVVADIERGARRRVRLRARESVDYRPLAWSPDGGRIALSTTWGNGASLRNALELVDLRRATVRTLVRNPTPYLASFSADWAPDGSTIVYDTGEPGEIFSIRPDGSARKQLTDRRRRFGDRPLPSDSTPMWSPDGSRIAFTSLRDGTSEVYVMDADGSDERRLTYSRAPTRGGPQRANVALAWSPDGTRIAFHRFADGTDAIAVVGADGRGRRDVCTLPHGPSVSAGVWSAG